MRALVVSALLLLASGPAFGAGDSLWCGQRIVKVGDPIWQVARKCPQPFWQEAYDRPAAVDRRGRAFGLDRIEVWTINFGPSQFMRRLEFVNGRLSRVRKLGYGVEYEPGSRRCGPYELGKAGETIAEVFARCGRPDYSYEVPAEPAYGYSGLARHSGERRVWTYDFGPRQQARELLFIDGRLSRISIP
ncbi:MAG: DUF2845 domain-containing protein [Wenzhouxiangella sp.]|jgi:hypothetical protein|nr:DUF2845 domain-containing protein [Wenzhouxiangella sp.]